MPLPGPVTLPIGDETDDALRERLGRAVAQLGGRIEPIDTVVAGSQEITRFRITLPGGTVELTAETYVGLSLHGDEALVDTLRALL